MGNLPAAIGRLRTAAREAGMNGKERGPQDRRLVRRVLVEGLVQGVGYRDFVRRAAVKRGVVGWVRNLADGSVEALLAGPSTDIETMLTEMRRGPGGAIVTRLRLLDPPADGQLAAAGFAIRPTA
jgi:acylphosphatase